MNHNSCFNNPEVEPLVASRRCPICFQDQSKVGAECRICTNPKHEYIDSPKYNTDIEWFMSKQFFRMVS